MRKPLMMALGAGLLGVAAFQFPDTVLAKSRSLQLESTTGRAGLVPIASRVSGQRAPTGLTKWPGRRIITNPNAKRATKTPARFGPSSSCHRPMIIHSTKTLVSALPEPKVCFGKVVHWHKLTYCLHCGGSPPNNGLQCATCKPGYSFNAATKACCKGGPVRVPK